MVGAGRRKARLPRKILRVTKDDGSSQLHPQMLEWTKENDESDYENGYHDHEKLENRESNGHKHEHDQSNGFSKEKSNGHKHEHDHANGFSKEHQKKDRHAQDRYDLPISPDNQMDQENSPPKLIDHRFERSPPYHEQYWDDRDRPSPRGFRQVDMSHSVDPRGSPLHHDRYNDYRNYYEGNYHSLERRYYDDFPYYRKENPSYRTYKYHNNVEPPVKPVEEKPKQLNSSGRTSYKHQHPEPTPEFPYQCETCDMLFKTMEILLDHQKTLHENNRQFACRYCSKKFNDKYNMRKHVLIHVGEKRHKCQFCEKAFLRKDHLRSHLQTHYNKKYGCRFCGKGYRTLELYERHLKVHREEVSNNPELSVPEIADVPIDALPKRATDELQKSTTNGTNDHSPVPSHFNEDSHSPMPIRDNRSPKSNIDRYSPMPYHESRSPIQSHGSRSPIQSRDSGSPITNHGSRSVSNSPQTVKCEENVSVTILDEDFNLSNQWSQQGSVLSDNDFSYTTGSPARSETLEHEVLTNQSNGYNGSELLSGFKCKVCSKVFSSTPDLQAHSELCKNEDKAEKFQCSKCNIIFDESQTLQEHYKKVHSIERTVQSPSRWRCKTCNINYPNSKELSRHYVLAHKDAQMFPCSECPKTFTVWHNLKKHMLIHLGDKKHKCQVCEKGFVRKDHLNSHMKVHLGDGQRFTCHICFKIFRLKQMYNKHMTLHSLEEKEQYPIVESDKVKSCTMMDTDEISQYEMLGRES